MDWSTKKINQNIHDIQVGCDIYSDPHLTKDCDLDENGNKKAQVCYSSGDRYNEDLRNPKREWKPYDEYKIEKKENYRQQGRGFYEQEKPVPKKKPDLQSILTRFVEASEKSHNDVNVALKEKKSFITRRTRNIKRSTCHITKSARVNP